MIAATCLLHCKDLMRSVPSVMDGLKPTQRKVLIDVVCISTRLYEYAQSNITLNPDLVGHESSCIAIEFPSGSVLLLQRNLKSDVKVAQLVGYVGPTPRSKRCNLPVFCVGPAFFWCCNGENELEWMSVTSGECVQLCLHSLFFAVELMQGEHSAYHHGESSLAGTIVSMAQAAKVFTF